MNRTTLEVEEALFAFDLHIREKLPELAADLLESGIDSPALRRLAGLIGPELDEANEWFERALHELGRPRLSKPEAARRLAVDLAQGVLEGRVSKREAARLGAQLACAMNYDKAFMPLYEADEYMDCSCHPRAEAEAAVDTWARATADEAV